MDLLTELNPLFRDEPPQRPVDDRLRAGRRALRRRRLGSALGVAAVMGALGTTYAVTSGAPSADGTRVATTATATPTPSPTSRPVPPEPTALTRFDEPKDGADQDRIRGFHVDLATGDVTAVAGGVVHQVVPMPPEPGDQGAVGVDSSTEGVETWWYLTWSGDDMAYGSASSSSDPPRAGTAFPDWVQAQQDLQLDNPPPSTGFDPPDLSDQYGNYTPPPGTEVLRRVDNPLGLTAPYTSVGLRVRDADGIHTTVFYPSGSTGAGGDQTIEDVVARLGKGSSFSAEGPMPPLTRTAGDGMPVARPGVDVLKRVDNPLGVAAPSRSVAFTLRFEGRTWWYLWELGPSGYYGAQTVRVARDGYPDIGAWIADQTSRADW